ncbi:MAG: hypothetical protein IMZ53_16600, partial [Thermoplasmata archaeon]|nr:hypothetical protein [Thermoplasmata archaeon]
LINKTVNGTIDIIAGESKTISTGLLFGIGNIQITVMANEETKTVEGKQFFILTMIKK